MQYNTEIKKTKIQVPKLDDGQVGVRATLNNMGFSNDAIGYDQASGTVTLNGKSLLKPGYLDDDAGRAYAKESDIQKSIVDFYRNSGNPVVRVSDSYSQIAGKYGLSANALSYGNGTVSIGGKPIDVLYIDSDGKSWANQNTVYNATEDYANRVGVMSPVDLAEEYAKTYLQDALRLSDKLSEQKEFSYDPDKDPVFQAYQNKYRLEGERSTREAVATYSALTGGYVNSAAATAGAQAAQYYAGQLSNALPELAKQAYQRYVDKYNSDISLLDKMVNMYNAVYQNASKANLAQRDNVNAVMASNADRDADSWKHMWEEMKNTQAYNKTDREMYWTEVLNPLNANNLQYNNQKLMLSNIQLETYQRYYEQLLQTELTGKQLDNRMTQGQIYLNGF